ncbi:signal peptidase I [Deinococcus radiodurans]|jgi:signal peptidase I (EC 3.4.21.89). Serine peptidase. MEROPS family S26A|uniref:Signal peptidase I n=1 Tax=Deinococcus radiodurans (strain ATCC 13939 / DSM 20539 / JCM 16871 / CCUG 27074 / LMG 4051 / NBRC 15346 / NCIMB 9279 / VKM B-1422 / R1) TaxID=243230 RepID=Q9RUR1_DEIRA|nr:signal peptidase I [Deinococcus radiodurans]AAF10889.1 signal peptidase I [Deinococcus radiodurans R1 = ATCC 13939 = DSM 20539]ANC71523.1 signal peptidase I [Deinococcus radiodurans R1 = ATCC 13939 = DSM 20539]QEM70789.1 signal peptidase I [Deinococcus radiodurans]QIP29365.1 signal peptidase I [Deinococcus radiodurans]QIP31939.1 signal peptidase I [Deinococcus radiodurans]
MPRVSEPPAPPSPLREFWRTWILGALLPAYLLTTFAFTLARVDGESMEPSLHSRELLLLLKYPRWLRAWGLGGDYLQHGDVVIFKAPADSPYAYETLYGVRHRPYNIKRVIGLPGDLIAFRDGELWRNGHKVAESYASTEGYVNDEGPLRVPPGKVWVMGDNRRTGASLDSRSYGPVDLRDVAGPVAWRLWPAPGALARHTAS